MTANVSKNNLSTIVLIIVLSLICVGAPTMLLTHFNVMYVANIIAAIIALTIAFSLPFRQKRISGLAITAFVVGILLFVSSLCQFLFDSVIAPLPLSEQFALEKVIQPEKISRGLLYLGMGITLIAAYLGKFKSVTLKQLTTPNPTEVMWFVLGVFYILIGMYYTFNGLHSL